MEVSNTIGSDQSQGEVQLKSAILIYSDQRKTVATIHGIQMHKNRASIGAGHPASVAALQDLVIQLTTGKQSNYLTENILAASFTKLVWFCPSAVRRIWFEPSKSGDSRFKRLNGAKVTHPNLIFKAEDGGLSVFAIAKDARPTLKTKLYRAPYWNVYDTGAVCQGSAPRQKILTPASSTELEDSFFNSAFTHGNGDAVMVRHPDGQFGFWKSMRSKRRRHIPLHWLCPTKLNLGKIIQ